MCCPRSSGKHEQAQLDFDPYLGVREQAVSKRGIKVDLVVVVPASNPSSVYLFFLFIAGFEMAMGPLLGGSVAPAQYASGLSVLGALKDGTRIISVSRLAAIVTKARLSRGASRVP